MPISWIRLETTLLGQHAGLALAIHQTKIKFSYYPPENPDTHCNREEPYGIICSHHRDWSAIYRLVFRRCRVQIVSLALQWTD